MTTRTGLTDRKGAEMVRLHVEHLLAAKLSGSAPPPTTAIWLTSIPDKLRERLAKAGLIDLPARQQDLTAGGVSGRISPPLHRFKAAVTPGN